MLLNLHKKTWMDGLTLAEYSEHSRLNENIVSEMLELAKNYNKVKQYTIGIFPTLYIFFEFHLLSMFCVTIIMELTYFSQALEDEEKMTPEQLAIKNVGKQDPKRHLEEKVDTLMATNIVQCLGAMLDTVVFK